MGTPTGNVAEIKVTNLLISLVGAGRFELPTPSPPGRDYRSRRLILHDKCFATLPKIPPVCKTPPFRLVPLISVNWFGHYKRTLAPIREEVPLTEMMA
jgi:hypothetical protein